MEFMPERLREIRILKRYTLEAVAIKLEVTKQAVSKYETGKSVPATDTIKKILDFFGISRDFLTNKRDMPSYQSCIFYRKVQRTPKKELEEAEVILKWIYEIIIETGRFYPLKKLSIPEFPDNILIKDKAKILRKHWGLREEPIRDIVGLLEMHGFYIFTVEMQNKKIDGYSQMIGDIPVIVLNKKKDNKDRLQFSIAHELGHLLMHTGLTEKDGYIDTEQEADEFAGCFLMPERALGSDLLREDASYFADLAKKWNVSPDAVAKRCKRLQLLGSDEEENNARASNLFQNFNRMRKASIIHENSYDSICTIRSILERIAADEEMASEFLKNLGFPINEIQRLCSWNDGFAYYEKTGCESDVSEIEGIQLSLDL